MTRRKTKTKRAQEPAPRNMMIVFLGMFLVGLGIFLGLSFATARIELDPAAQPSCVTGLLGAWAAYGIILTIGHHSAFFLAGLVAAWGFHVMHQRAFWSTWPRVLGALVMVVACAMLSGLFGETELAGGLFAHVIAPPARLYMGTVGVTLASAVVLLIGAFLTWGHAVFDVADWFYDNLIAAAQTVGKTLLLLAGGVRVFLAPRIAQVFVTAADHAIVLVRPGESVEAEPVASPSSRSRKSKNTAPAPAADKIWDDEVDGSIEVDAAVMEPEIADPGPEFVPYGDEDRLAEKGEESAPTTEPTPAPNPEPEPEPEPVPKPEPTLKPSPVQTPGFSEEAQARLQSSARPTAVDKITIKPPADNPNYVLPPMNLLDSKPPSRGEDRKALEKRGLVLEKTLAEFKIDGKVVRIDCGPRVTMFEMTLAPGIKLSRVIGLADNIAMALAAQNVRIIAPIPGKDTIGIEIPNIEQDLVTLREVVETIDRDKRKQALPICLAKDVSGAPVVADLAKMPHLLIAGATGSGKSVCINSVLLSFLMCCKPRDVKCILIDPKVVELSRFRDIPHLMSPVITDMKRAVGIMEWVCQEMDERYEKLSMVHVNNIAKFNALGEEVIRERLATMMDEEETAEFPKHLPYIVVVIDELADLMMVAGKEIEQHITRLAAKSRAVGIHLILATQRPSVDVITGLIKANMPSRIAFQVSSKVDSRTILDANGAETLLGQGDMLYLPPGVSKVLRAQGVFVSDEELFGVVDFCKEQMAPEFHEDLEGPVIGGAKGTDLSEFDELFIESGRAILESGRGSVSLLQRKLGIGYGRAARIIDQLAQAGVLGPFREGKARDILMTSEEFQLAFDPSCQGGPAAPSTEPRAGQRDDEIEIEFDEDWDELPD